MAEYVSSWTDTLSLLRRRLKEPPRRLQLLTGPRQVGKTTLLLELRKELGERAVYAALDGPEAAMPGAWDRLWRRAAQAAAHRRPAILLLDEVQHVSGWALRLKGEWDRTRRERLPLHVVATGSSALRLGTGSRDALAGRFERLVLGHWQAAAVSATFRIGREEAAAIVVRTGAYPGTLPLRKDVSRLLAYVRDSIVAPAIGRDVLAMTAVRKPAMLRQVFTIAATSPAAIVSLQKIQGSLTDRGALDTVAQYLRLLEEAYLVAPLEKHSGRALRRRAAPPKLVALSNAFLAALDPEGPPSPATDRVRFGAWLENACLAFAWNAGQRVTYWREEPVEVDAVAEGTWGRWAIEVKIGQVAPADLRGLFEFVRRNPSYRPLVVCEDSERRAIERLGAAAVAWTDFLHDGPPRDDRSDRDR